jgi:hypothetical protein
MQRACLDTTVQPCCVAFGSRGDKFKNKEKHHMVKGKHAKGKGRKGGGEVLLHRVTQRSLSALALAFIFLAAGPATAFAQIQLDGDAKLLHVQVAVLIGT